VAASAIPSLGSHFQGVGGRAVQLAWVGGARESPLHQLLKDTPAMGEVVGKVRELGSGPFDRGSESALSGGRWGQLHYPKGFVTCILVGSGQGGKRAGTCGWGGHGRRVSFLSSAMEEGGDSHLVLKPLVVGTPKRSVLPFHGTSERSGAESPFGCAG